MLRARWLMVALVCSGAAAQGRQRRYSDAKTGVSFAYPAAWTADGGLGYGGDPLKEEKGKDDTTPPLVRLSVGWTMGFDEVSFAYAILPVKTAAQCAAHFTGWSGDEKPGISVIHGVTYWAVTYQDAGLGHSWSFDLYTVFRKGRCLGFSVGSNHTSLNGEDPIPMSAAQLAVPSDPDAVMKTVRIR